jgi:tRNA (cytidine/uridine-2'-O-)-methyltransferase
LGRVHRPDGKRSGSGVTTRATRRFDAQTWQRGDWLVFGSETAGLPDPVRETFAPAQCLRLPLRPGQRSLNLSNAVAVVVFEAWRQLGYDGGA